MKCVRVSLQPLTYSPSVKPVEVQEELHGDQEEKQAELMEQERVLALLQRKKLVQELGVVEQLRQLLQGHTAAAAAGGVRERGKGGGILQDSSSQQHSKQAHQRQQPNKVTTENDKRQHSRMLYLTATNQDDPKTRQISVSL